MGYKPLIDLVQQAVLKKMGEVGGAFAKDLYDIAAQKAGIKNMQGGQRLLIFEGLSGGLDFEKFMNSPELILTGEVSASIGLEFRRRWNKDE